MGSAALRGAALGPIPGAPTAGGSASARGAPGGFGARAAGVSSWLVGSGSASCRACGLRPSASRSIAAVDGCTSSAAGGGGGRRVAGADAGRAELSAGSARSALGSRASALGASARASLSGGSMMGSAPSCSARTGTCVVAGSRHPARARASSRRAAVSDVRSMGGRGVSARVRGRAMRQSLSEGVSACAAGSPSSPRVKGSAEIGRSCVSKKGVSPRVLAGSPKRPSSAANRFIPTPGAVLA